MILPRLTHISPLLLLALTLTAGCAMKDSDKVADAQSCLDNGVSTEALACAEKVSGIETEAAYLIRCSATFIYQEFTSPTRLATISTQMSGAGGSPAAAIGLLSFSKPDINTADTMAAQALVDCEKSKSKGMLLLASMARVATNINKAGIGAVVTNCDPSNPSYNATSCATAVGAAVCAADNATLGGAATAAYQQSCQGSSQDSSSVCAQYQAAIAAGATPAAVGASLRNSLSASGTCP